MYYALVLIAGVLVAFQGGMNSVLDRSFRSPYLAALVCFALGTLVLLGLALALGRPAPGADRAHTVPPWAWLSGVIGAAYVLVILIAAPRIGSTGLQAASIAGTMAASLVLDHYALSGYPRQPASAARLGGVALMLAGAAVIALSGRPASPP